MRDPDESDLENCPADEYDDASFLPGGRHYDPDCEEEKGWWV